MSKLERFFSPAFRPIYLLTGAGTALAAILGLLPSLDTPNIAKLPCFGAKRLPMRS
jgi:hypothetical protein